MIPFQELRLWSRSASAGDRAAAAVATVLVLCVLGWALVPSRGPDPGSLAAQYGATGGTGAPAAAPAGPTAGGAGAPGPSLARGGQPAGGGLQPAGVTGAGQAANGPGVAGATGGPGSAPGAGHAAACPRSSSPGVSGNRIRIAIILVNIAGPAANSLFGISTPDKQRAYYDAAISATNAAGGVACRKIVAEYFNGNPADESSLQQTCLDIQSAGVFAVVDGGAYAQFPIVDCYARAGIPYFGGYLISGSQRAKFYPYLFEFNTADSIYHSTVLALKSRHYFDPARGFKKLGFVYRSCDTVMIANQKRLLADIVGANMVTYDVGCPNALANPADIQQAVMTFQRAGVTHVTTAAFVGDFASFTNTAQQQGFKPTYGLPDDALVSLTSGSQHPDYDNIADAVAITATRSGDESTPGTVVNPGTRQCNAAFAKYGGLGNVYKLPQDAGNACGLLAMFTAAVGDAPALQRNALAEGLRRAKSVEFSFPQGPNDFTGDRVTTGGQFWRPLQFHRACDCWQILDRAFKRGG